MRAERAELDQFFSAARTAHESCSHGHTHHLAAGDDDGGTIDLTAMVEASMKRVWGAKKVAPDLELIGAEGAAMMERVERGFGRKLVNVGYREPDFEVLANLQYNAYVHAAFKNHSFGTQLQALLTDGKGAVRSYAQFKAAAGPMVSNYYDAWLKAEHQTALATGQMAAKWQTYQATKDALPFLTYLTVGDARVRDSHRVLDGITKPIDDPFWDTHFPPNGWRCRCDVIQSLGPEEDGGLRTSEAQHPPAFRHNPGKDPRFWAKGEEPYRPKDLSPEAAAASPVAGLPATYRKTLEDAVTKSFKDAGYDEVTWNSRGRFTARHHEWERGASDRDDPTVRLDMDRVRDELDSSIILPPWTDAHGIKNPEGYLLSPAGGVDRKRQMLAAGTNQPSRLSKVIESGLRDGGSRGSDGFPKASTILFKLREWDPGQIAKGIRFYLRDNPQAAVRTAIFDIDGALYTVDLGSFTDADSLPQVRK